MTRGTASGLLKVAQEGAMIWKAYLLLWVALCIYSLAQETFSPTLEPKPLGLVVSITSSLQAVAIYGFIYKKPVFSEVFWKWYIIPCALGAAAAIVIPSWAEVSTVDRGPLSLTTAILIAVAVAVPIVAILFGPAFYAHYKYAFRMPEIWTP